MSTFGGSELLAQYYIQLGAQVDDLYKSLDGVRAAVDRTVKDVSRSAGGGLTGMFRGLGASLMASIGPVAAVVGGVGAVLGTLSTAAERQEKANRQLARSFRDITDNLDQALTGFNDFASRLSAVTSRSETSIKKLAAIGASSGGFQNPEQIKQAVAAAQGLAATYEHMGVTTESAMQMISDAAKGNFTAFERLGISVEGLATGQDKYNKIMQVGVDGLRDAADEANSSGAGLRTLWNSINNLMASVGKLLGLGSAGGEILKGIAGWIDALSAGIQSVSPMVDELTSSLLELLGIGSSENVGFESIIAAIQNMLDGAWTGVQVFMLQLKGAFIDFINWFLSFIPTSWAEGLISAWGNITTGIQNLWDQLTSWIAKRIVDLEAMFDGIISAIGQALGLLGEGESFLLGQDPEAVKKSIDEETERSVKARNEENERQIADRKARLAAGQPVFDNTTGAAVDDLLKGLAERTTQRMDEAIARMNTRREGQKTAVDQIVDEMKKIDTTGLGVDPNAVGGPQSIQTILGQMAIPGIGGANDPQVREQKETNRLTREQVAILQKIYNRRRFLAT